MELILGKYKENINCESFKDPEIGLIRVRTLSNKGLPTKIVIECRNSIREEHKISTQFRAENVKVCKKPDGKVHLRAKNQMIYKLKVI